MEDYTYRAQGKAQEIISDQKRFDEELDRMTRSADSERTSKVVKFAIFFAAGLGYFMFETAKSISEQFGNHPVAAAAITALASLAFFWLGWDAGFTGGARSMSSEIRSTFRPLAERRISFDD